MVTQEFLRSLITNMIIKYVHNEPRRRDASVNTPSKGIEGKYSLICVEILCSGVFEVDEHVYEFEKSSGAHC